MRLLAALGLAAGFLFATLGCSQAQGRVDYCAYGHHSSLFMIDRTTPYDQTDQQVLLQSAGAVVDGLRAGDRLVVVTIGSHYSMSNRVFDECRPGCPATSNPLGDVVTGCASMIALRDERIFRARLIQALRPLMNNVVDDRASDITGTIAQTTREAPGGRPYTGLYIFSDMLENSQALPWRLFESQSAADSMGIVRQYQLLPLARGAAVRIVGFGRLHDRARSPLRADLDQRIRGFWGDYFAAGGARELSFETMIAP